MRRNLEQRTQACRGHVAWVSPQDGSCYTASALQNDPGPASIVLGEALSSEIFGGSLNPAFEEYFDEEDVEQTRSALELLFEDQEWAQNIGLRWQELAKCHMQHA